MKLNPDNNTSHNDYINASFVNVSSRTSFQDTLTIRTHVFSGQSASEYFLKKKTFYYSNHVYTFVVM